MIMRGSSVAAVLAVVPFGAAQAQTQAQAQAQPAPAAEAPADQSAENVEQVVVSASRISIAGYSQPTPVTVVGAQQLATEAKADIGDAIRELPALSGSGNQSPQSGSNSVTISGAPAGQSNVDLRNLGLLRTLVLFDGQRVVQSNITGGVDLNTIPTALVQRVDIVTGGASAAWGSDAVAGVVNLVLNKNFSGFKADIQGSDNSADTYRSYKAEATWGTDFAGGRGHLILSGDYVNAPDTVYTGQASWYNKTQLVPNPVAGGPTYIHASNIGQSQATPGGLITASAAGTNAPADALKNIEFQGPNATPVRINPGYTAGAAAWGGDLGYYDSQTPITEIANPYHTTTLFAYGSYKLSDTIRASLQLNYGKSWEQNSGQAAMKLGNLTIQQDNAYLPASIRDEMIADGIPSFTMGTLDTNNCDIRNITTQCAKNSLGIPVNNNYRQLMRGVFTLDGSIGNDWSWNAYYQHGEVKVALRVINNTLTGRLNQAADAVVDPSTGGIVCRSTLTDPTNGCVPLDVFGTGVASQSAISWINSYGDIDWENITLNEDVLSGSMQGTLPWGLEAGPVAVAFGAEYRKEGGRTVADPRGATASWGSGNFADFAGQYHVEEGFLEVDAPILKNSIVQSLDFNGAGRMTSYSTSGLVETWKLGLTSQVNDDVRLRTTWSTDIRAPDLSELFASHQININSQVDLHSPTCTAPIGPNGFPTSTAGCGSQVIANDRGGNPALVPEVANTVTGGIVLTPHWVDGLQMSFDWYDISIKKSIVTLQGDPVQCAAGVQTYCDLLVFGGAAYSNGLPALSTVQSLPVNAASERTSGLDMQVDYAMDLFTGNLLWHFVGNYNDEHTIVNNGVTCDTAGNAGTNLPTACVGLPKFNGIASATYSQGPVSFTLQTRFTGAWKLNPNWTSGIDVDDNDLPWKFFLDLRASYSWNDNIQFYGAIDNVTNAPPQVVPPMYTGSSYQQIGAQSDMLGRVMRVGVRLNY